MIEPVQHLSDGAKHTLDALSFLSIAGVLAQVLPSIAAGLTVIWMCLRIFDWFEARLQKRPPPKD